MPTAVGKTKLSVELAKIYNGEIINADSTQVYKGMDIGNFTNFFSSIFLIIKNTIIFSNIFNVKRKVRKWKLFYTRF